MIDFPTLCVEIRKESEFKLENESKSIQFKKKKRKIKYQLLKSYFYQYLWEIHNGNLN